MFGRGKGRGNNASTGGKGSGVVGFQKIDPTTLAGRNNIPTAGALPPVTQPEPPKEQFSYLPDMYEAMDERAKGSNSTIIMMTPREILKKHAFRYADTRDENGTIHGNRWVLRKKLREAKESGLYDDIKQNGMQKPIWVDSEPGSEIVYLGKQPIVQGHHRLACLLKLAPDTPVRVEYASDDYNPY